MMKAPFPPGVPLRLAAAALAIGLSAFPILAQTYESFLVELVVDGVPVGLERTLVVLEAGHLGNAGWLSAKSSLAL
jgi:hypothetical protein